jgi:hypothetical protein
MATPGFFGEPFAAIRRTSGSQGIMLVTDSAPGDLEPLLRTLAEADPNLTITSVRTMQEQSALRTE